MFQPRIWRNLAPNCRSLTNHPGNRIVPRRRERFNRQGNRRPSTPPCLTIGASKSLGIGASGAARCRVDSLVAELAVAESKPKLSEVMATSSQSSQWQTNWRIVRDVVDLMMMLLSWLSFRDLVLPQKGHLCISDVTETDFLVVQVRKTG